MPVKKEASSKKAKKISKSNVGNIQTVIVKVGGEKKKRKRAPRKPKKKIESEYDIPMRQLPPVVYQVSNVAPTSYGSGQPALFRPPEQPMGITVKQPSKVQNPILEDIGQVGTEGRVEILDLPTKAETLRDLGNLVPLSSQSIASISSGITQPQKPISPTPSLFGETTIPSNLAFNQGTQEQNVFDFGMAQVYDQPDDISTLTNPTYRRPRKSAKKEEEPQPPSGLFRTPTQTDINLFFQPRKREVGLLEGIREEPSVQTTKVSTIQTPFTDVETQATQNILLSSPAKQTNPPITLVDIQEQKSRLKKVARPKSPPKIMDEPKVKRIGKTILKKDIKPPAPQESTGIFA